MTTARRTLRKYSRTPEGGVLGRLWARAPIQWCERATAGGRARDRGQLEAAVRAGTAEDPTAAPTDAANVRIEPLSIESSQPARRPASSTTRSATVCSSRSFSDAPRGLLRIGSAVFGSSTAGILGSSGGTQMQRRGLLWCRRVATGQKHRHGHAAAYEAAQHQPITPAQPVF